MSTYGPYDSGRPDDPYQRPAGPPPVDPTLPQWGPPPAGSAEPPTTPFPGQQPTAGYPPPAGGYPPPPGPFPPAGPTPAPFPPAGDPGSGPWGAPPPPGYPGAPVAPARPKRGGRVALIVTLVVLLVLCPCLGLAGWGVWKAAQDDDKSATPSTSAPVVPTDEPTAEPTTAEPSPTETTEYDLAKGDCVVNDGTDDDASLRKVKCGPNTYQVLLRIPGTNDGDRCKKAAPTATANYVNDNPLDSLDFVLCLKKRTR